MYVKIPERVVLALNLDPEETYRVMKYMYGLYYAGWPSASPSCPTASAAAYLTYVYSTSLVSIVDESHDIEELKAMMEQLFEIIVLADRHSGVNIEHRDDELLKLTQLKLLNSILTEFDDEIKAAKGRHMTNRPVISDEPFDRMSI